VSDPVPSKDQLAALITQILGERCPDYDVNCMTCQAWRMFDQTSASEPSKDLCSQLRALPGGFRLLGYTAAEEIERLQRQVDEPCAIRWTDEQDKSCMYTHLIGHTPFGRVLITWKGWKEHLDMALDESPWGASGYVGSTVEDAKSNVEAEFNKRIAMCYLAQPPSADDLILGRGDGG
jgi:hypothetical protein